MTAWTAAQRERALAIYAEHGLGPASAQTGIPKGTIACWAHRNGVQTVALEKLRNATETIQLTREQRVARLAQRLLDEAETEVGRLREPTTEHKLAASGREITVELREPTASDRRAIATTAAILIDKSQLLVGGATARTEHIGGEQAQREIEELQRVWRERQERRLEQAS